MSKEEPKWDELSWKGKIWAIVFLTLVVNLIIWVALPIFGLAMIHLFEAWGEWFWFLNGLL